MTHPGPALDPASIPVVVLCGGAGTRLREETEFIPKPMVTVGGKPILWHLLQYYSTYGFRRFVLCLGYKAEVVKNYFLNYHLHASSFSVRYGPETTIEVDQAQHTPPWTVSCVDTGDHAMTGARIHRVRSYTGDGPFMLTYGDGLADVDLDGLLRFHRRHGKLVTVTGVHPPARFGLLTLEDTRVVRFAEKTHATHDYINGGFFVCNQGVFDYLADHDDCVFEQGPLESISRNGQMEAYLHDSFWQCMDTMRDREVLEEAWAKDAPWKRW